jgi:hypothetical protein
MRAPPKLLGQPLATGCFQVPPLSSAQQPLLFSSCLFSRFARSPFCPAGGRDPVAAYAEDRSANTARVQGRRRLPLGLATRETLLWGVCSELAGKWEEGVWVACCHSPQLLQFIRALFSFGFVDENAPGTDGWGLVPMYERIARHSSIWKRTRMVSNSYRKQCIDCWFVYQNLRDMSFNGPMQAPKDVVLPANPS